MLHLFGLALEEVGDNDAQRQYQINQNPIGVTGGLAYDAGDYLLKRAENLYEKLEKSWLTSIKKKAGRPGSVAVPA